MKWRDFVPPIAYQLKDKLVKRGKITDAYASQKLPDEVLPIYTSYGDAETVCGDLGYEQDDLVDVVFQKTGTFRDHLLTPDALMLTESFTQSLIGSLYALSAKKNREINILDFGGGCGTHYFAMKAALGNKTCLNWHIVETSAMVEKAKAFETEDLRFFSDIVSARKAFKADVDYLHSSGAIQYTPNPESTLKEILAVKPRYIMLNRLVLSLSEREIITIQESLLSANGPGSLPAGFQDRVCKYPVTYYPKQNLEKLIRETYSILFKFTVSPAVIVDGTTIINAGYVAERVQ